MKAVVWTKYGPPEVLELREVETPSPADDEVRIRIHATTVTAGDSEVRAMRFPFYLSLPMRIWRGFLKPRPGSILGTELAGEIESVGNAVKNFKVGDKVFGSAGVNFGTNAQYICLPEDPDDMEGGFTHMPANMTLNEAATVPFGGRDALHFLRKADLRTGAKILINGAGGSIGTFAVQLAKLQGAEVTAVDSGAKLEMLQSIGADHVIDYNRENFTQNGVIYDVIFDVVGTLSFSETSGSITPNGTYLLANPIRGQILAGPWTRMTGTRQVIMETASGSIEDLIYLRDLIEAGKLTTVIDRTFPLEQIVEAHRYVDRGGKLGNLVITID